MEINQLKSRIILTGLGITESVKLYESKKSSCLKFYPPLSSLLSTPFSKFSFTKHTVHILESVKLTRDIDM